MRFKYKLNKIEQGTAVFTKLHCTADVMSADDACRELKTGRG